MKLENEPAALLGELVWFTIFTDIIKPLKVSVHNCGGKESKLWLNEET